MEKKELLDILNDFRKRVKKGEITELVLLGINKKGVAMSLSANSNNLVLMDTGFHHFVKEHLLGDTDDE